MASTLVDLVKIVVTSAGSGAITLGASVPGYRGVEALTNGNVYSYSIQDGDSWEFGRGTYMSETGQFIRTPIDSSNGGLALNLRANAQVAFVALAEDLSIAEISQDIIDQAITAAIGAGSEAGLEAANSVVGDKANASAIGVSGSDTSLGEFPGTDIPGDMSVKQAISYLYNLVLSVTDGSLQWSLPDEADGDIIPSAGSGLPYLSAGVLKIA